MNRKLKVFWPNFGNPQDYFKNSLTILSYIQQTAPTRQQVIKWLQSTFHSTSPEFCRKLLDVFKNLGLVEKNKKILALTLSGRDFLKVPNEANFLQLIREKVIGIDEMFLALSDGEPASNQEVREKWEAKLPNLKFAVNQSRIRLDWLIGLGYITSVSHRYFLTKEGLKQLELIKESQLPTSSDKERISHKDLEDKIKIIGEFFEFEAKTRPSINEALPRFAIKLKQSDRQLDCLWVRYIPFAGMIKFPIEIQLSGNISDALDRLETVAEYVQKAIVITTEPQEQQIIERLTVKKSKLLEKLVFLYIDDIYKAVEATNVLKSLTKKIFFE